MDAKLKALKVVDLKDILAKAAVSVPAKANKQDLIARILASNPALDVYHDLHSPKPPHNDDLLAPPEDVDWNVDEATTTEPTPEPKPQTDTGTKPTSAPKPKDPTPSVPAAPAEADEELEKRKKRAARFGVPLVEPPKVRTPPTIRRASVVPNQPAPTDQEEAKARAARFGTTVANIKKRPAAAEPADTEELERRRKRAERFGLTVPTKP